MTEANLSRRTTQTAAPAAEITKLAVATPPAPKQVAARLGFDEKTIGRLEARGHLHQLALTEQVIRTRLYRAALAHLRRQANHRATHGTKRRHTRLWLATAAAVAVAFAPNAGAGADDGTNPNATPPDATLPLPGCPRLGTKYRGIILLAEPDFANDIWPHGRRFVLYACDESKPRWGP